jgi:hypothetical protein
MEGWLSVQDELPPVGQRVSVRHYLNHSYDCTGQLSEDGKWSCANAFILPNMMLVWNPTHWRPLGQEKSS